MRALTTSTVIRITQLPLLVLLCPLGLICVAARGHSQEPEGASLHSVRLERANVDLRFRYCPTGDLKPGETIRGFYILETELSQRQFLAVLAEALKDPVLKAAWDEVRAETDAQQYIKRMEAQWAKRTQTNFIGDDYPIFQLGPHEVLQFCVVAQRLAADEAGSAGAMVYQLRLPELNEWKYACRGSKTHGRPPFFNRWPDYKATFADDERKEIEGAWRELKKKDRKDAESAAFSGSQEDLTWLLEEASKDSEYNMQFGDGLIHLSRSLEKAIGIKKDFHDLGGRREVLLVTDTVANEWGVRHMHGNVAEWVLASRADWPMPEGGARNPGDRGSAEKASVRQFYICGGHYRILTTATSKHAWKEFTIEGPPSGFPHRTYATARNKPEYESLFAGIRLVLDVQDSDKWLARVRQLAVLDPVPADLNARLSELDKGIATVAKLFPAKAREQQRRVELYKGLLRLRKKDDVNGRLAVERWLEDLRTSVASKGDRAYMIPKDRLTSLLVEERDLELCDRQLAKDLRPHIRLCRGLLAFRGGDGTEAVQLFKEWCTELQSFTVLEPLAEPSIRTKHFAAWDKDASAVEGVDGPGGKLGQDARARVAFARAVVDYRSAVRSETAKLPEAAGSFANLDKNPIVGGDDYFRLAGELVRGDKP